MAVLENGFPFDNMEYDATALGAWLSTRTRGVFSAEDHYAVTSVGGMQVNVSSGIAWLKMNEQWGMVAPNPAAISLTVDVGDTILNRIDVVCLRIDKNQSVQEVVIKKGTLAASPVYPALVRDLNHDEVFLAAISVPAGTTELSAALITDLRLDETYCGLMRDGVTGIPTAMLQEQAEALIEHLQEVIDGVIDGSQYMLKTEYAPDTSAAIQNGSLALTSNFPHMNTSYDMRFIVPDGYTTGMSVVADGAPVAVRDSQNEILELDIKPGVPFYLMREGASVFPKSGGIGTKINVRVVAQPIKPVTTKDPTIWIESATPVKKTWIRYDEPTIANEPSLAAGDVWVKLAATSETYVGQRIKILSDKKFDLPVGVIKLYQRSGANLWEERGGGLYVNGTWYPITLLPQKVYIYNLGNTGYTWTWQNVGGHSTGSGGTNAGGVYLTGIRMDSGKSTANVQRMLSSAVNFTGYTTLCMEFNNFATQPGQGGNVGISGGPITHDPVATTYRYDLAAYQGSYQILFTVATGANWRDANLYGSANMPRAWIER